MISQQEQINHEVLLSLELFLSSLLRYPVTWVSQFIDAVDNVEFPSNILFCSIFLQFCPNIFTMYSISMPMLLSP